MTNSVVLLSLALSVFTPGSDDLSQITEKRIGDNVLVLLRGNDGNLIAVKTDEGVLVIDSFSSPVAGAAARKKIEEFSDKPIRYLINTHHHGDHITGNQAFADAPLIAHARSEEIVLQTKRESYEAVRVRWEPQMKALEDRLTTDLVPAQKESMQQQLTQAREYLKDLQGYVFSPPDVGLWGSCDLRMGGVTFKIIVVPPVHTATNLIIYVPEEKLLVTGDLIFAPGFFPYIEHSFGGAPAAWIRALDDLLATYGEDTKVVPGHGDPGGLELLRAQRECLRDIIDAVVAAREHGLSLDQAKAEVKLEKYQDCQFFGNLANNIEATWKEIEAGEK